MPLYGSSTEPRDTASFGGGTRRTPGAFTPPTSGRWAGASLPSRPFAASQGSIPAGSGGGMRGAGLNLPFPAAIQPGGGGRNPYFDPNSLYGNPRGESSVTQPSVGDPAGFLEQNPNALFTRWAANFGGGTDPFSQFVQSQQQRIWDAYMAAAATNDMLTRQQFLGGISPDSLRNQFLSRSPFQRGRLDSLFGSSPIRTLSNG